MLKASEDKLDQISNDLDESEERNRVLGFILQLANVQADTMTSIAAFRLGEEALAKESLVRGAHAMQDLLKALRAENDATIEVINKHKADLAEIERQVRGQR